MQFAKDSFYMTLAGRLGALNPGRTVTIGGVTRPAVVAEENECARVAPLPAEVFRLRWGEARTVAGAEGARRPLMKITCEIRYRASGDASGMRRGRALAALDLELLQMCTPRHAPKSDFTGEAEAALGSEVFWNGPEFLPPSGKAGELERTARLTIFFYPEVECS